MSGHPKQVFNLPPSRRWKILAVMCVLLILAFSIPIVVLVNENRSYLDTVAIPSPSPLRGEERVDTTEAGDPGIFHDLTKTELISLQDYLYSRSDLNLVRPGKAALNVSYVYTSDLMPPNKEEVLDYLNGNGAKPPRRARILVFRGDKSPPVVEEYVVGTFPNPTEHVLLNLSTRANPVPFAYRPVGVTELSAIYNDLFIPLEKKLGNFFQEAFDAGFRDCGKKCLTFYPHPVSSALLREDVRKMFFGIYYSAPYYALHPVDFVLLANIDGNDSRNFTIEFIIYNNRTYSSVDEFKREYDDGRVEIKKTKFPIINNDLFSTLHYRGENTKSKRNPQLVQPDGTRYTLRDRHVHYMGWHFDFRLSTLTGPQVYNIRYGKDRIAYEVGLQEIAVFYSGANPASRMTDFIDSGVLLGTQAKSLVPGGDCPETASFIPATFLAERTEKPHTNERAFCLFEQNTGLPLRRHMSYSVSEGGFYGGVMDTVLILRTILTVANYDYIFDFIFHQNGAMEVRAVSTGYIFTSFYSKDEDNKYGFRLHDNILANVHHHMFHFKVDLDILGRTNRYETLNIETEDVDNSMWTGNQGDTYNQIYFTKTTKTSEKEAAYKFNFDTPRYHIFHNEAEKTKHGVSRAYRVQMNGMSKQTLRENGGNEGTIPWARYQMAVTKFKQDEFCSSSPYKFFDGRNPVVDFQKFIDDNETIVDEDLVLWLTMGVHHIPHTEDLPITPTPGAHLSFALLPYNYFEEDPSMKSPDTVTVNHKNPSKPEEGVIVRRYHNTTSDKACVPLPTDDMSVYEKNPDVVLQSKNQLGFF